MTDLLTVVRGAGNGLAMRGQGAEWRGDFPDSPAFDYERGRDRAPAANGAYGLARFSLERLDDEDDDIDDGEDDSDEDLDDDEYDDDLDDDDDDDDDSDGDDG